MMTDDHVSGLVIAVFCIVVGYIMKRMGEPSYWYTRPIALGVFVILLIIFDAFVGFK